MIDNNNALKPGTILESGETRYRIVEVLGQGGFGITYLAMGELRVGNVTTEGKFAIKEHFPSAYCSRAEDGTVEVRTDSLSDFEASRADFIAEARKLHRLGAQNDNIVKVNEVFEANGTAYYVMQYINGESLSGYVRKNGLMPYNEAIELLSPIIDAVGFLHKERINHLDIKPDNIMLHESVDGVTPILVDFGLCMHFTKSGNRTSTKGVQGVSEGYSPLEQYVGINEFQPETDIYALMATLYFTLTGEAPKGAAELKISDIRERLLKVAPPQAVEGICKAMHKLREERTPSIAVLKGDLGLGTVSTGTATVALNLNSRKDSKPAKEKKQKTSKPVAVASASRPVVASGSDEKRKKMMLWGLIALVVIAAAIVLPLTLGRGGSNADSTASAEPVPVLADSAKGNAADTAGTENQQQEDALAEDDNQQNNNEEQTTPEEPKPEAAMDLSQNTDPWYSELEFDRNKPELRLRFSPEEPKLSSGQLKVLREMANIMKRHPERKYDILYRHNHRGNLTFLNTIEAYLLSQGVNEDQFEIALIQRPPDNRVLWGTEDELKPIGPSSGPIELTISPWEEDNF